MKLGHLELFVAEPHKAKEFYVNALGFELVAEQGESFAWVKSGGIEILLRPGAGQPKGNVYRSASSAIVLYCDDLLKTKQRLEENGVLFTGDDGGEDCPVFQDPDGNWFQLVNPEDMQ